MRSVTPNQNDLLSLGAKKGSRVCVDEGRVVYAWHVFLLLRFLIIISPASVLDYASPCNPPPPTCMKPTLLPSHHYLLSPSHAHPSPTASQHHQSHIPTSLPPFSLPPSLPLLLRSPCPWTGMWPPGQTCPSSTKQPPAAETRTSAPDGRSLAKWVSPSAVPPPLPPPPPPPPPPVSSSPLPTPRNPPLIGP